MFLKKYSKNINYRRWHLYLSWVVFAAITRSSATPGLFFYSCIPLGFNDFLLLYLTISSVVWLGVSFQNSHYYYGVISASSDHIIIITWPLCSFILLVTGTKPILSRSFSLNFLLRWFICLGTVYTGPHFILHDFSCYGCCCRSWI